MASSPQSAGRERTIASGDVEIAVTEFPNPGRPPVVLLHGIGSRGQSWWPVIDPLAARFHLYQLDLRGHGASGKPSAGYLMEHYAADLDAALDALDLQAGAPHHGPLAGSAGHALLGERAPGAGRRAGGRGSVAARPTGHRGGIRRLAAARRAHPCAGGRLVPAGIPGLERRRLPAPRGDDHLDGTRRLRRAASRGARSAGQWDDGSHAHPLPGCRVRPCSCTATPSWGAWWRPPTPSGSSRSCRADARSRFPGPDTACTATPAMPSWRR